MPEISFNYYHDRKSIVKYSKIENWRSIEIHSGVEQQRRVHGYPDTGPAAWSRELLGPRRRPASPPQS